MPNDSSGPIRNQIRRLRFERGEMTQQALTVCAGMTRQTTIALEDGKCVPSLLLASCLARAVGKDLDEVFEYEPPSVGTVW